MVLYTGMIMRAEMWYPVYNELSFINGYLYMHIGVKIVDICIV